MRKAEIMVTYEFVYSHTNKINLCAFRTTEDVGPYKSSRKVYLYTARQFDPPVMWGNVIQLSNAVLSNLCLPIYAVGDISS